MNSKVEKKLDNLPSSPGVYFHKNAAGEIIYIGKAANLRNRVRQYFQKSRVRDPKTDLLVAEIADIDWTEVESEVDALFLEAEMVRRYMPPYNILLRDDKSLSYVRIDYKSDYPTVTFIRRPMDDSAQYFGPYISSFEVKKALRYLRRAFPYAISKPINQKRAGLHYHLGLDPGLEDGRTTLADYRANLRKLMEYLRGNRAVLIRDIEREMKRAAKTKDFETAAKLRNQLFSLQALNRQVLFSDREMLDASKDEALVELASLLQLYENESQVTHAYEVQGAAEQQTEAYTQYGEGAAQAATPQFTARSGGVSGSAGQQARPLRKLRRIEGFDVSHIQGTDTVASMVVFINGVPSKTDYRKFKMHLLGNDDYGHMREAVTRRFRDENIKKWRMPDVVLIDGGKGQLRAALDAFSSLELPEIAFVGLAKRHEDIIVKSTTGKFSTIQLSERSHLVKLLQRIRDESHRFAVSYHTSLRGKRQTASLLDEVPGIGPLTHKKLIRHFGSVRALLTADESELQKVLGPKTGKSIAKYLAALKN